ncbi:MAG: hypothetical protein HRU09_19580 [Oligoflexales bacterium]|nr:hypothetical protein [Oligoflexales bacterium]
MLHSHIARVGHIVLGHELIASLEELHLIKKHRPRFNAVGKRQAFKHYIWLDPKKLQYVVSKKNHQKDHYLIGSFGSKRSALLCSDSLPEIPREFKSERSKKIWINRLLRKHEYPKKNLSLTVSGRTEGESCQVHIQGGLYQGYSFIGQGVEQFQREEYPDIKRLICSYLTKSKYS